MAGPLGQKILFLLVDLTLRARLLERMAFWAGNAGEWSSEFYSAKQRSQRLLNQELENLDCQILYQRDTRQLTRKGLPEWFLRQGHDTFRDQVGDLNKIRLRLRLAVKRQRRL